MNNKTCRLMMAAAALLLTVPVASAQLSVIKGQTRVGELGLNPNTFVDPIDPPIFNPMSFPTMDMETNVVLDTTANLCILGKHSNNSGGLITFGDRKKVYLGEYGVSDTNILTLGGYEGLRYVGKNVIFSHSGYPGMPFSFNGPVSSIGLKVPSDKKLQSNSSVLTGCADLLYKLNPVTYTLTKLPLDPGDYENNEEIPAALLNIQRYGFNVTEIRKTFPSMVSENTSGYATVDYSALIPVLVSAVNELNERIREQEEIIASMSVAAAPAHAPARADGNAGIESSMVTKAFLDQNRPNPFSVTTTIECSVPEGVSNAFLCVYDLQGKQLMHIDIEQRGTSAVSIDGSSLQPGMYIYALIADGVEIDTKRMILTD